MSDCESSAYDLVSSLHSIWCKRPKSGGFSVGQLAVQFQLDFMVFDIIRQQEASIDQGMIFHFVLSVRPLKTGRIFQARVIRSLTTTLKVQYFCEEQST